MSELAQFVEESVEPVEVEEVVEAVEPEPVEEVEPQPEETVEAVEEIKEQEGLPTEPNKEEETGNVPIKALMAEREKRQAFERKVAELESKVNSQQPVTPQVEAPVMPTLESVGYDEAAYAEAVSKFYADQVDAKLEQREQEREAIRQQVELETKLNEFNTKGMALGEEYRALIQENDLLQVTEAMRDTFLDADNGHEVILQLAKVGQLDRIAKMSTNQQIAEVARLCERAKAAKVTAPPTEVKEVEAPTSITSITAQGGNQKVEQVIADPLETTFNR